jgi:hypothetical protein
MSRNIDLSYSEWEIISGCLSDREYHPFMIQPTPLKEWEDLIKAIGHSGRSGEVKYCFKRVNVHNIVQFIDSPKAINTLWREYWRRQDMPYVMDDLPTFIGFALNHIDGLSLETTMGEWASIKDRLREAVTESDQRCWTEGNLAELCRDVCNLP